MTLRYMTGESREDEERRNCQRCDNYRGYVCAEHRKQSYDELEQKLAEATNHEQQTHERLGAILGTDTSLEDAAKRMAVRLAILDHAVHEISEMGECEDMAGDLEDIAVQCIAIAKIAIYGMQQV